MEYNHETLGSVPLAKGWEGIAEVAVQIPLFNRNQGNVGAARADVDRAGQEKKRIALTLRERAASAVDQYANARLMAMEYRDEMLPRAKKAYSLMVERYGQMLASYPRVLDTQRKLFELQIEYISTLESVWTNGIALQGFLLTDGLEGAVELANRLAPEHLELMVAVPAALLPRVRHAGAIFLGAHTPEVVGDYVAGPNHVLPTAGTARFASPLGTEDFVKRSSVLEYSPSGLAAALPHLTTLSRIEGLTAHGSAAQARIERADSRGPERPAYPEGGRT